MPRLIDGTEVDSNSEAYRHECEARAVLRLPTLTERRAWLEAIDHRRGVEAGDALRRTMTAIRDAETRAGVERHWGPR